MEGAEEGRCAVQDSERISKKHKISVAEQSEELAVRVDSN